MKRRKPITNQNGSPGATTVPLTNGNGTHDNARLMVLSDAVGRLKLAYKLGMSFGGERDIYKALGYSERLTYDQYWMAFKRQDIAKAIIDRPVKATWRGPVELLESDDDQATALEKAWTTLYDDLKLKSKFSRLDKMAGIGRYSVLLLGFSGVAKPADWLQPVQKGAGLKLLYVRPVSEANAEIKTWEKDSGNPRFGHPLTYEIRLKEPDGENIKVLYVHHSRVIHVVDECYDSEVYGLPRLEVVYNRLQDLEKLVGGSAEMFWKGARPGYQGEVDPEYSMTPKAEDDLKSQIDEYEHNLRRIILAEGVKLNSLNTQVSSPGDHVDVQIQMISAVTGIPKRILTGSERGELSSAQDSDQWNAYVKDRRDEFVEPSIIRPFVDRMMELGILPETDQYSVKWEDLFAMSEKDKAELGRTRATALKEYTQNPGSEFIIPPAAFMEFFLGLSTEEIELIDEMRKAAVDEEERDFEEVPRAPEPEPEPEPDETEET